MFWLFSKILTVNSQKNSINFIYIQRNHRGHPKNELRNSKLQLRISSVILFKSLEFFFGFNNNNKNK